MYTHRVRYRECDPMNVVYHTHYLDYFEAARTEALRELGLAYKELETVGIIMPVVEVQLKYHRSCYYDDLLEITTIFPTNPSMRIKIDYEVRAKGDPKVRVSGSVTLCFVDTKRMRPILAPPQIVEVFEKARENHAASSYNSQSA